MCASTRSSIRAVSLVIDVSTCRPMTDDAGTTTSTTCGVTGGGGRSGTTGAGCAAGGATDGAGAATASRGAVVRSTAGGRSTVGTAEGLAACRFLVTAALDRLAGAVFVADVAARASSPFDRALGAFAGGGVSTGASAGPSGLTTASVSATAPGAVVAGA
jgi:hypothetical protein